MYKVQYFHSGTDQRSLEIIALAISQWLEGFKINGKNPREVAHSLLFLEPGKMVTCVSCRIN